MIFRKFCTGIEITLQGLTYLLSVERSDSSAHVFPQTLCPNWGVLSARVKAGAWSGCSIWPPAFLRLLLWHVHVHVDCVGSHKIIKRLFRCPFYDDLARVSWRTFSLSDIWRSWPQWKSLWEGVVKTWWNPVTGPCMILCKSLWEDLVKIWLTSFERSFYDLAWVLLRRSCGDPDKFLSKRSLHDPVQVLVRRSRDADLADAMF